MTVTIRDEYEEVYLGVDPSTKAGVVALNKHGELVFNANLKQATDRTRNKIKQKRHPCDRLQAAVDEFRVYLDTVAVLGCCVERYAFNMHGTKRQSPDSIIVQCRFGEALRQVLWGYGVSWLEVSPTQLKQYALGKGTGGKDEIRLGVFKKWGQEFPTDDECDAYVLAKMAFDYANGGPDVFSRNILKKVENAEHNVALCQAINF